MQQTIDVTGLSPAAILALETLVGLLRTNTPGCNNTTIDQSTPEWAARFQAWIDSHPKREIEIDDSRESIY
jgi:hypothetical protein